MIPYIVSHSYTIASITLQTWGTFVALGFLLGAWISHRRAKRLGLNATLVLDMVAAIMLASMIGARIAHVLLYEPGYYLQHPWEAIDPRAPGYALFGGLAGAALVFWYYVRRHALDVLAYADTLVWGLPWGCGVGRIGCFLIHDHPGTLTHIVLGVRYPDGITRHDLGLYLSLVGFGTGLLFLVLARRTRTPGFWLALYLSIEAVSRFSLDFLRVSDVRYAGLTPTQYLAVPMFIVAGWLFYTQRVRYASFKS